MAVNINWLKIARSTIVDVNRVAFLVIKQETPKSQIYTQPHTTLMLIY